MIENVIKMAEIIIEKILTTEIQKKKSLQLKCRVQLIVTINNIVFASGVYLLGFYVFAMK